MPDAVDEKRQSADAVRRVTTRVRSNHSFRGGSRLRGLGAVRLEKARNERFEFALTDARQFITLSSFYLEEFFYRSCDRANVFLAEAGMNRQRKHLLAEFLRNRRFRARGKSRQRVQRRRVINSAPDLSGVPS